MQLLNFIDYLPLACVDRYLNIGVFGCNYCERDIRKYFTGQI